MFNSKNGVMKKRLCMAILWLVFGGALFSTAYADDPIDVTLQFVNEKEISQGNTKTPTPPLVINQDGNVLTLPATPVDYMLELRDENGILVYYTFIPQGTTQIVLPSTLSGDFEIRLVADTYYYIGYLTL